MNEAQKFKNADVRGKPNARGKPVINMRDGPMIRVRGKPLFIKVINGGIPRPDWLVFRSAIACPSEYITDEIRGKPPLVTGGGALFRNCNQSEIKNKLHACDRWGKTTFSSGKNTRNGDGMEFLYAVNAVKSKDVDRLKEDMDLSACAAPDNVTEKSNE